jgi:uncharacterized protein YdeI (YjbR/CyaY-like superfamily)
MVMPDKPKDATPIVAFKTQKEFETWLGKKHATVPAVWVRFFKKGSTKKTITYSEALDVALCYGWIDSQLQKYDDESYLQKFSPRTAKSIWSKKNTEHVERLIREKKMKPSGLAQVMAAKKDGRWDRAYQSSKDMTVPKPFLTELKKHPKAHLFFKTLNKANVYAIGWRLQTAAKPETYTKRQNAILKMLMEGKRFH